MQPTLMIEQKAGITFVPGIDPEDMPKVDK